MLISLEELQKRHTMRVLERVGGNKSQAAEILGISRATIYQLLGQARSASS
jgi:two-component system response regulator HydG